jgi:hypothetical protein
MRKMRMGSGFGYRWAQRTLQRRRNILLLRHHDASPVGGISRVRVWGLIALVIVAPAASARRRSHPTSNGGPTKPSCRMSFIIKECADSRAAREGGPPLSIAS